MPAILLIEDDITMRELLRMVLEANDHLVTTAEDAESGETLLSQSTFDLVVCDQELPGINGRTLLEKLRARGVSVPFLLTSGNAVDLPPALGASFLKKPFPPQSLPDAVKRALGGAARALPAEMLVRIRERYLQTFPARVMKAVELAHRLPDAAARADLATLGHQWGGSGKSNGVPWISEAGALIEKAGTTAKPCPSLVRFVEKLSSFVASDPPTLAGDECYEALKKEAA